MGNKKNSNLTVRRARNIPDMILVACVFTLVFLGWVAVSSASANRGLTLFDNVYHFSIRQGIFIAVGTLLFILCTYFNYHAWERVVVPLGIVMLFLLVIVLMPGVGKVVGGARRWISIAGFSFQPSEMSRFVLMIYLAFYLRGKKEITDKTPEEYFKIWGIPSLVAILVIFERDFSSAVLILGCALLVVFSADIALRYLFYTFVVLVPLLTVFIVTFPYRLRRIFAFLDPFSDPTGQGYHTLQSMKAIIQGGVMGKGLGESVQKLGYLPEPHTDFIFSVLTEELGLVIATIIIVAYAVIFVRGLRIARTARDREGTLLAVAMVTYLLLPAIMNIGVNIGVFPPTGVPLTFISYGGTSLICSMAASGILLNISRQ